MINKQERDDEMKQKTANTQKDADESAKNASYKAEDEKADQDMQV